jgi:hypothetical protein
MEINITTPILLNEGHVLQPFDCGNDVLNNWLRQRAIKNQYLNASRTFVTCLEGTSRVVGYYSIATGSVSHADLGRSLRQNMPDPIPVVLLGRLAVDVCTQGHHFGKWLLQDAVMRITNLAEQVGIRLSWFMLLMRKQRHSTNTLVLSNRQLLRTRCSIRFEMGEWS